MKVIAFDGTIVNLDKYQKVETKQVLGMLTQLADMEGKYVVTAVLTVPGFLSNRVEREVLGIYDSEDKASEIRNKLFKSWCDNDKTFIMPKC